MKTDEIPIYLYIISFATINLVYIAVFFGFLVSIPRYIRYLNIFIQVFLCGVLMVRFHPYREKPRLHRGDSLFIFGVSFILFTNVVLVELSKLSFIKERVNDILFITPKPISSLITKISDIRGNMIGRTN